MLGNKQLRGYGPHLPVRILQGRTEAGNGILHPMLRQKLLSRGRCLGDGRLWSPAGIREMLSQ